MKSDLFRAACLLALILCAACGGPVRPVTGQDPFIQLEGIKRDGMQVDLALVVSNHNDLPWPLAAIELELRLDDAVFVIADWRIDRVIDPRSRETLTLPATAALAGLERLESLAEGVRGNLPYTLSGELTPARGRSVQVQTRGFLHPVPGHPDRFR